MNKNFNIWRINLPAERAEARGKLSSLSLSFSSSLSSSLKFYLEQPENTKSEVRDSLQLITFFWKSDL